MKRLTYLFAILLISSVVAWADETITVTAKNSDISANLDLKVVAKLFGEAKDLEEFEKMLNDPQQALVNLDLNGDGDVDYIRVIETTNGNKHLIVLQAVLAKDIYQDVASIYVEKDEANNVSVQVIGDEYIYGKNYVIEPVYIYRPVIYPYACIGYGAYYHRCYDYHHNHYGCSFHYAKEARPTSHRMAEGVSRRDYATTHAESSFDKRNTGITNARELSSPRQSSARTSASPAAAQRVSTTSSQTAQGASTRSSYSGPSTRSSNSTSGVSTRSSSNVSTTRSASSASSSRQASYTPSYNTNSSTRSASTYSSGNSTRNTYSSGNSSTRSSYSGSSTRSSYSGGSSFSGGGGGYSGGSSRGGGGVSTRR